MRQGLTAIVVVAMGCAASVGDKGRSGGGGQVSVSAPAAQYGVDPKRKCPDTVPFQILADEVREQANAAGAAAPRAEGRLCAAAEALLGWDDTAGDLPESALNLISWASGLPSRIPGATAAMLETEDPKEIAVRVAEPIARFAKTTVQPTYGVAMQRLRRNATRIVLVLQDPPFEMEPVPRRLATDGRATLSGRLLGPAENPKIFVCDPSGHLERPEIGPGKNFRVELRCGGSPGIMLVEIRADEKGTAAALARFPVGCGVDPPAALSTSARLDKRADGGAPDRALLDAINTDRAAAHLPALAWDDAVAGVARSVSESQRDGPQKGEAAQADVAERLKRADVVSPLILMNPGQAPNVDEAHARFSVSPMHRCNYLNAQATHAGAAVVDARGPDGRPLVVVTELFVRELPPMDAETARGALRKALLRKRADARAPRTESDPTLEGAAQEYAEQLAAAKGDLARSRENAILAPLRRKFRTIEVLAGAKSDPVEFAEEPGVLAKGRLHGIGVAQGADPVLGKNAVYVVILIGAAP